MIREAIFANQGWYPQDPGALSAELDRMLHSGEESAAEPALGVISPHAGYRYSGQVAGALYRRVNVPDRVIVLSVNHRGYGRQGAVWPGGSWAIPGAVIPVDEEVTAKLLARVPSLDADTTAHQYEHSDELQLPFLHRRNPNVRVTHLTLRFLDLAACLALGREIAALVGEVDGDVLVVASSDMNHYERADVSRKKDDLALERVRALDPEGLYRVVADQDISMCGIIPATVMLQAAISLGATRAQVVAYANSGDVTHDYDEVVGYAGVLVA